MEQLSSFVLGLGSSWGAIECCCPWAKGVHDKLVMQYREFVLCPGSAVKSGGPLNHKVDPVVSVPHSAAVSLATTSGTIFSLWRGGNRMKISTPSPQHRPAVTFPYTSTILSFVPSLYMAFACIFTSGEWAGGIFLGLARGGCSTMHFITVVIDSPHSTARSVRKKPLANPTGMPKRLANPQILPAPGMPTWFLAKVLLARSGSAPTRMGLIARYKTHKHTDAPGGEQVMSPADPPVENRITNHQLSW